MSVESIVIALLALVSCAMLVLAVHAGRSGRSRRRPPSRPGRPVPTARPVSPRRSVTADRPPRPAPPRRGPALVYDGERADAPTLRSKRFGISARPDGIVRHADGSCEVVEFKAMAGRVQEGHRVQAIAGAIAALDSGFDVRAISVELGDGTSRPVRIDLRADGSADAEKLYARISRYRDQALVALAGNPPKALPGPTKCARCSYLASCTYGKSAA